MFDIIIIGAGPAGLTAAIYGCRADKKVLVLEKETFGGQITSSPCVENYPGIARMSGNEFGEKLIEQAMNLGAQIELAEAEEILPSGQFLTVRTDSGDYEGKCVILATGVKHRSLGLLREEDFVGNGISYCAVCDGAFYAGKHVAVVGGGNSALQEALWLADVCEKVTVVQNLACLTGEKYLIQRLEKKKNVALILSATVEELLGEKSLTGVRIWHADSETAEELPVDGLFICIGQVPENGAFADVVGVDARGYIAAGEDCLTGHPGIFAAGDCRTKAVRQITTATGDGAVAAVAACHYLDSL